MRTVEHQTFDNAEFSYGYITSNIARTAAPPERTVLLLFGTGALGLTPFISRKVIA